MSMDTLKVNIIKKAWEDADFKARLLADPRSALEQDFGHSIPEGIELHVMAVTPTKYALIIPPKPEELDELTGTGVQPQMLSWN
ncbi:NHLP leader peptide family natural product precursor [Paenibacillus sp. LMG 31461]|uniref:NHLP leader peptide family natural product n=1 Tax=Paenibacillus plantarum TaxID=2654975 RepID=A0ABX1XC34_9BACL|nr:NHLP leader peptide family RiPP precursor [Paenibacillus plantarum]NOU65528.1 NHLP leader peptide family natural product precursor [Paenibacillus plantarum]